MEMENVFEKPLIVNADSTVSKAVSKMLKNHRHEATVMDGDEFYGVLSAADLLKTGITNPEKTSIKPLVKRISPMDSRSSPGDILNTILVNDCRSLPVKHGNRIFVVSKIGLLKLFKAELELKGRTVGDVMNFPFCIGPDESISTARALIRDVGVPGLVIIDEKGKADGIIDALRLLRAVIGKESVKRGEESGEKIRFDDLPVKSLASKTFIRTGEGTPLLDALGKMTGNNTLYLVVEREGKVTGLVTPKDILKLAVGAIEGVRVTVSGIQEEDNFVKSIVDEEIEHTVKKLGKIMPLSYFVMHIRKYHKTGRRVKYSVHARLITGKGDFFAEDHEWDLTKATKGVLAKIEKEVLKKDEKTKVYRRGP